MTLFELPYILGYSVKKRYALKNRKRLPNNVISIGNITLGGTGKTPAVMALAKTAAARGFYPCILTRGYRGKAEGPCLVSKGDGPLLDAHQAGDEAVLMAERLPGVPIVKAKDRYEAGMFARAHLELQPPDIGARLLFILDDGFQHWILCRDKDILLIDGTNPFGNRKLFPLGPLREPLSAIRRADIIVITNASFGEDGTESVEIPGEGIRNLTKEIRQYVASAQVYLAQHSPTAFKTVSGNMLDLSAMRDKKVFAFCGIGNPHSFQGTLLPLVGELTGRIFFRDHYQYSRADFQRIADNAVKSGADWIVTTEKDIMRLKGFLLPENLLALCIEFHVDDRFYTDAFDLRR